MENLKEIGKLLNDDFESNKHYTTEPMFCLQILQRDSGYDQRLSDNRCWYNGEMMEMVFDDDTKERKADLEFEEESEEWEGPYGYRERWETVMVAFTQKGIDEYMNLNGHNVKRIAFRGKTRTYVESFFRCEEMIGIRNSLMTMAKK